MGDSEWARVSVSSLPLDTEFTDAVRDWWKETARHSDMPIGGVAINWLDFAVQHVGPLCYEQWTSMPIYRWQTRFPGVNVVLVFTVDRLCGDMIIYGLVKLLQHAPNTPVREQLVQRCWLHAGEVLCQPSGGSTVRLIYPTLETAHALNPELLDCTRLDPVADQSLIQTSTLMMVDFAKAASSGEAEQLLTKRYNFGPETLRLPESQLNMAKMRYYTMLMLAGMAQSSSSFRPTHEDVVARGIGALRMWTSALIGVLCPTEQHVAEAISTFSLPLKLRAIDTATWMFYTAGAQNESAAQSVSGSMPLYMQIGVFSNTTVMHRFYARVLSENPQNTNAALLCSDPSGVLLEGGLTASLSLFRELSTTRSWFAWADDTPPPVFDVDLPTSLFMRLRIPAIERNDNSARETRMCLLRWLVAFLAHNMCEIPATARLTVMCEYEAPEVLFFSVQELVFKGGARDMYKFTLSWMAQYRLVDRLLELAPSVTTCFVPHLHPHTFQSFNQQSVGELVSDMLPTYARASSARALTRSSPHTTMVFPRHGEPFHSRRFGDWVGGCIVADLELVRIRISNEFDGEIKKYAKAVLGSGMADVCAKLISVAPSALLSRLQELSVQSASSSKPGSATNTQHVVFSSNEYLEVERRIAQTSDGLASFFRYLMPDVPIRAESGGTVLRANGKLVFRISGARKMSWRDFGSSSWSGVDLGSLVQHQMHCTPVDALQYMKRFLSGYASSPQKYNNHNLLQGFSPDSYVEKTIDETRLEILEKTKTYTRVKQGSVPNDYLRRIRGLSDAPVELIENNPVLFASTEDRMKMDDGTFAKTPTLVAVTQTYSALQRVYVDASTGMVIKRDGKSYKRTHGKLALGDFRTDSVRLQCGIPAPTIVVVAEGLETALSVCVALCGAWVFASLGISNIRRFRACMNTAHTVVVCMENDLKTGDTIEKKQTRAQDVRQMLECLSRNFTRVVAVAPDVQFGDFNDVHQKHNGAEGTKMIRSMFERSSLSPAEFSLLTTPRPATNSSNKRRFIDE